jgi:GAF domain-containing protein
MSKSRGNPRRGGWPKSGARDTEERTATQPQELAALYALSAVISQSLDLGDVLNSALEKTLEVLEIETGGIYLLDEDSAVLNLVAQRGFDRDFVKGIDKLKLGEGFSGHVALSNEPLLIADVAADPRLTREVVREAGLKSAAIFPLSSKGKVLGTFFTIVRETREFSDQDIQLLTAIGQHIGVAIENARLYEDAKNQLAQRTALQKTTSAIASTLELNDLLNLIIQHATALLQADGGMINLVDWESRRDEVVAATGSATMTLGYGSSLDNSLSGWATLHNQPTISIDVRSDNRVDPTAHSYIQEKDMRSAAVAPLAFKGQVIGTLVVAATQGGKEVFHQSDLDLLVAFANQAAIAIENARLYEQAQERMRELEALRGADTELYRHLSLDEVLQALVDIGVDILRADKSSLVVWDETQQRLVARVVRGFTPETKALLSFSREEGTFGHVFNTGEPVIVEDALGDPRKEFERLEVVQASTEKEGIRSFMHLPIKIGDEVFGVFSAIFTTPQTFGEDDLRRFTALAGRAALAIENARLYEQAHQVAVLEERNRLARELHDSVKQKALAASFQIGTTLALFERDPQSAKAHLEEAENLVDGVRTELTDLILELRPEALIERSADAILREYALDWSQQNQKEVDLQLEVAPEVSLDVKQTLLRILQESLTNVARHSEAKCVSLTLSFDGGSVTFVVKDDGIGFDQDQAKTGLGLQFMHERAEALGGSFQMTSTPGEGTSISAVIPYQE